MVSSPSCSEIIGGLALHGGLSGLNKVISNEGWQTPNIRDMLMRMGYHAPKYFAVVNLTSGFFRSPYKKAVAATPLSYHSGMSMNGDEGLWLYFYTNYGSQELKGEYSGIDKAICKGKWGI